MDKRQQRTVEAFGHVLVFLQQHALKPEPPLLGRMRRELEEIIRRARELALKQDNPHGPSGRWLGSLGTLRTRVRREMMALVRVAKPLLKHSHAEAALRVPHARAHTQEVAKAATAMADALTPHLELLEEAGYSKEFLDELRSEAQTLAQFASESAEDRNDRARATMDIAATLQEGMRKVMVIEGLVLRAFADTPEMIRLWKNRRRVSKRIGRPKRRGVTPNRA